MRPDTSSATGPDTLLLSKGTCEYSDDRRSLLGKGPSDYSDNLLECRDDRQPVSVGKEQCTRRRNPSSVGPSLKGLSLTPSRTRSAFGTRKLLE